MDKNRRKVKRKKQRIFKLLASSDLLALTDSPSHVVLVGNSGLVTGASRESILGRFLPHATPHRVLMVPGRQFSVLEFNCVEEAQCAMRQVDGAPGEPVLYLSYLEKVPESLCAAAISTELPPGAVLVYDFLSEQEEDKILNQLSWGNDGSMKHRQAQHFGYAFDYCTNNVDPSRPLPGGLPPWCDPLVARLRDRGLIEEPPDQLTVNRYLPGQGIPPHVDTHGTFRGPLISVSLGGATTMEFTRPPPQPAATAVRLPRRSALVMDGEARYLWTHGIAPRKTDVTRTDCGDLTLTWRVTRVSLTFRRLRGAPCHCPYPAQCDSQVATQQQTQPGGDDELVLKLERAYVAEVYERIADHFSSTRHKPWPRVRAFVEALPTGSLLLDVGCGNGKYLGLRTGLAELGVDQSTRLCNIAQSRGHETVAAGCLPLPIRESTVDACICIAVIHHLANRDRRVSAVAEIARVLRPAGSALIYVWALEQRLGPHASGYLKPGRHATADASGASEHLPLPVHTNRTEFRRQDMLVPWKLRTDDQLPSIVHHRYYHVYREGELEEDVQSVAGLTVEESWYDQGNWCVLVQKQV